MHCIARIHTFSTEEQISRKTAPNKANYFRSKGKLGQLPKSGAIIFGIHTLLYVHEIENVIKTLQKIIWSVSRNSI